MHMIVSQKKNKWIKCFIFIFTIATIVIFLGRDQHVGASSIANVKSVLLEKGKEVKYKDYINQVNKNNFNNEVIDIEVTNFSQGINVESYKNFEGKDKVLYTSEQGIVEWEFEVKKAGLYAIDMEYYPIVGYGSDIERVLTVNGVVPYVEAQSIELTRIYVDEVANPSGEIIRPNQVEEARWIRSYITDSLGYYGEGIYIFLEAGKNTIGFQSVKEPMIIGEIRLESKDLTAPTYEEVLDYHRGQGAKNVEKVLDSGTIIIQAENTFEKGDPTLYSSSDSTSTKTQPFDYKVKYMNTIGGLQWKYSNQWMSWKVNVPEAGFYHIGARSKQNFVRDIYCNRSLYINGKLPFAEAANIHFSYNEDWVTDELGEESPYLFYFDKGDNTISLKVTAGDLKDILTEADNILENLNSINMELLALLSITPDVDRDYQIGRYMPETVESLGVARDRLQVIYKELILRTNTNDTLTSQLEQLIQLLDKMYENPDKIASLYSRYRELIGTFGNWIMTVREHPLQLDYLYLSEVDAEVDKKQDGFFRKLYSGFLAILYSFTEDSSVLSEASEEKEAITVWIGSGLSGGRDQAMALNEMIKQSFTNTYNIPVNLQLVPADTILMATLAGRGPDIALQVEMTVPVDYALRNAVYDLTKFDDYNEISERFFASAAEPFQYDNGVYALPETMSFPMLFYRTDVLDNLGIDVNKLKTWESLAEVLPILQGKNMNVALPATMQTYSMFLYQMGGEYYTDDMKYTALNSKKALSAFEYWTDFYSVYSLPIDFSFENRFRTGEMPIGIADYTTYNLLSISAPEIKGKWAMIELPGIVQEDGSVNNTAPITSKGCILMNNSKNKEAAWEFMKWWTNSDAQYEFGKQLEAVMGAAARYNTANEVALSMMPWAAVDRIGLMNQAEQIRGIPQIPGGYYTERNLNFAKLAVLNDGKDPREQLTLYADSINEEIKMKRKEFALD